MRLFIVSRTAVLAAGLSLLPASIASTAEAQSYPPNGSSSGSYGNESEQRSDSQQQGYSQQDGYPQQTQTYPQQPQQGYDPNYAPPPGFDDYDRTAPSNYDPSRPPPPPPGYRDDQAYAYNPDQDRRYEAYAEDWSQRYCTRARSNAGAGAVIGGLLGALVGSGLSGRHDHGSGALLGGVAGAAGGAVVGSTSANATSPGCPPGFVVRNDAPTFYYEGSGTPYYYAAPGWYQPWIFVGGRWNYRPYPYHGYYYSTRFYGRGGYRGGPGRGYHGWRGRRY